MNIDREAVARREARIQANSDQISQLWRPEADHVLDLVQGEIALIAIAGRSGSSKSSNLKEQVIKRGESIGYRVAYYDAMRLSSKLPDEIFSSILNKAPDLKDAKGIFMLDEAINVPEQILVPLLKTLHERKYVSFIPMIRAETDQEKDKGITPWLKAEQTLGGAVSTYEVKPKQLPEEIAREFLAIGKTPDDLASYIVSLRWYRLSRHNFRYNSPVATIL